MSGFNLIIQPDEEDDQAAGVFVDGAIGGSSYVFLLDTGAARSSVGSDDFTAAFESTGKNSSSGVFAGHEEDLITVPSIELGPISKRDFTLTRKPATAPGATNLIGMDLLKDYCCHFLFDEKRVVVNPPQAGEYALQELFLGKKFHPYVDVSFDGQKAAVVWDTGAGITLADLDLIERHPTHFQKAGDSVGTDSSGASMETPMYIMSGAVIGRQTFPPHRVAGVDLSHVNSTTETPMSMILGYSTLSKANWIFDFPRKRWAITQMIESAANG